MIETSVGTFWLGVSCRRARTVTACAGEWMIRTPGQAPVMMDQLPDRVGA